MTFRPENLFDNKKSLLAVIGPEEDPGKAGQDEGKAYFKAVLHTGEERIFQERFREAPAILSRDGLNNKIEAVECAPDDESPVGAVPQAADQEDEEQVEVPARDGNPVSTQGNIEVIAEPG